MASETGTIGLTDLTRVIRQAEERLSPVPYDPELVEAVVRGRRRRMLMIQGRGKTRESRSRLWDDYCEAMRKATGVLPHEDYEGDPRVDGTEAAWWLGAYSAAEAVELDDTGEIASEPGPAEIEAVAHFLDVEDADDIAAEFTEGWRYSLESMLAG